MSFFLSFCLLNHQNMNSKCDTIQSIFFLIVQWVDSCLTHCFCSSLVETVFSVYNIRKFFNIFVMATYKQMTRGKTVHPVHSFQFCLLPLMWTQRKTLTSDIYKNFWNFRLNLYLKACEVSILPKRQQGSHLQSSLAGDTNFRTLQTQALRKCSVSW